MLKNHLLIYSEQLASDIELILPRLALMDKPFYFSARTRQALQQNIDTGFKMVYNYGRKKLYLKQGGECRGISKLYKKDNRAH